MVQFRNFSSGSEGSSRQDPVPTPRPAFSEPKPQFESQRPTFRPERPEQKPPKKKSKKKTVLTVIIALILILSGAAGAWYFMRDEGDQGEQTTTGTDATSQNTGASSQTPIQHSLDPFAVAYSYYAGSDAEQLFWRPIAGGDRTSATTLTNGEHAALTDTYGNKALAVTYGSPGSAGANIWYSSDSGKTYSKIFSGSPGTSSSQPDQITSAIFSNDGSSIIMGYLPSGSSQNTVKEIDLASQQVTDLFSLEDRGIFVQGYNTSSGDILYQRGCYGCDGQPNKLLMRNMNNGSDRTVYEDTSRLQNQVVPNASFTKTIVLNSTPIEDGIGGGAPYFVTEVDLTNGGGTDLASIGTGISDRAPRVGYNDKDGSAYYSSGTGVYQISGGNSSKLFEASTDILDVYLVNDTTVVASSGDYNDFTLTHYNFTTKESTLILSGDANTRILGITYN